MGGSKAAAGWKRREEVVLEVVGEERAEGTRFEREGEGSSSLEGGVARRGAAGVVLGVTVERLEVEEEERGLPLGGALIVGTRTDLVGVG